MGHRDMKTTERYIRANRLTQEVVFQRVHKLATKHWGEPLPGNSRGHQLIAHRKSLLLHRAESSLSISLFICRLAHLYIATAILKHRVIKHCELAGRRYDCFRRTRPRLDASVKGSKRSLALRHARGRNTKRCRRPIGTAFSFLSVNTLPLDLFVPGHRLSHEVKCFSVFQALMSKPTSPARVSSVSAPKPEMLNRSTPVNLNNCTRMSTSPRMQSLARIVLSLAGGSASVRFSCVLR